MSRKGPILKGLIIFVILSFQYCNVSLFPSFPIAGVFLAKPLREKKYITIMDPFQQKYGDIVSCTLVIPLLIGDILWMACIMAGLGKVISLLVMSCSEGGMYQGEFM